MSPVPPGVLLAAGEPPVSPEAMGCLPVEEEGSLAGPLTPGNLGLGRRAGAGVAVLGAWAGKAWTTGMPTSRPPKVPSQHPMDSKLWPFGWRSEVTQVTLSW